MTAPAEVVGPRIRHRERAGRILREPRLLVLLLAGGIMATIVVFVIGFSSAFYTATSSDYGSTIKAGKIELNLSNPGELINGAALKPGATRSGTVTVTNRQEEARVSLRVSNLVDTPASGPSLADLLNVTVRETAPSSTSLFYGKLRALTSSLALGTWEPGEQRTFQIDVAWPPAVDSLTYANVKTTFEFDWRAESVPEATQEPSP